MQHRELSGAFSDEAKWSECWKQLSTENSVGTLRVYHNNPAQLEGTANALSNNSSVHQLEIGVVEGRKAVTALGNLLLVSDKFCLHSTCGTPPAAGARHTPSQLAIMRQGLTGMFFGILIYYQI